jgi:hypothetical protein
VPNGKYTVSIRAWYKNQADAPCQLLMAKTSDKNSTVVVMSEKNRFVQQVFIKGFSVKAGKEIVKDFDFACKSMFAGDRLFSLEAQSDISNDRTRDIPERFNRNCARAGYP